MRHWQLQPSALGGSGAPSGGRVRMGAPQASQVMERVVTRSAAVVWGCPQTGHRVPDQDGSHFGLVIDSPMLQETPTAPFASPAPAELL